MIATAVTILFLGVWVLILWGRYNNLSYRILKLEGEPTVLFELAESMVPFYTQEGKFNFPFFGSEHASGFDVKSSENVIIGPGQTLIVGTGIKTVLPDGYEIQARSRSGLAAKHGIHVLNSPGTIDQDYRGEIKAILHNTTPHNFTISKGDRIMQLVLARRVQYPKFERIDSVDDFETDRGTGGLGSTGK